VRELVPEHPVLVAIVEPLLTVWQTLREQIAELDRQVRMRVREDAAPPDDPMASS
jgi:transposase